MGDKLGGNKGGAFGRESGQEIGRENGREDRRENGREFGIDSQTKALPTLEQVLHFRWASCMFLKKKKIFLKTGPKRGVTSGVKQFHTQFTYVSRECWALNRKQKK